MDPVFFPVRIDSDRVILLKHSLDILDVMYLAICNERQRLSAFMPWVDRIQTKEDSLNYLKKSEEDWKSYSIFDYGIYRKSDMAYMGNIGIHSLKWPHAKGELGYWLTREFEGKGYVRESIMAIEKVAFDLGLNRIEIRCNKNNLRSIKAALRSDYRLEGFFLDDIFHNGHLRDSLIFAKLRKNKNQKYLANKLEKLKFLKDFIFLSW